MVPYENIKEFNKYLKKGIFIVTQYSRLLWTSKCLKGIDTCLTR